MKHAEDRPIAAAWEKTLLRPDATIADAIKCLDNSGKKIAVVAEPSRVLLGAVTDGDIRRALLRGLSMCRPVSEIMTRSPLVAPEEMDRESALQLMRANKISQLPIVDGHGTVTGVHTWDDLVGVEQRDNLMVVMAGGFGKRLRPYTDSCPKPMLKVGNKPMLEHILNRAIKNGFRRFVFSLHYMPDTIMSYFGDGARWGVHIDYTLEKTPMGTAGALALLDPLPTSPFVVTNGDIITDINYADLLSFHVKHNAAATMAVRQHEWQHPFGVVKTDGVRIVSVEEKPVHQTYVNAGIYALNPELLAYLKPATPCDMPDLFEILLKDDRTANAYAIHEHWVDIGRPDDFHKLNINVENH